MKNKKIMLVLFLLFYSMDVSAISLNLRSPEDEEIYKETDLKINGTASELANITYSVDSGSRLVACYNCTEFENMTGVLSKGDWHTLDINVSKYTNNSINVTESIRFQVAQTKMLVMQRLFNFVGDIVSIFPKIIKLIVYGGVIGVVAVFVIWVKAKITALK